MSAQVTVIAGPARSGKTERLLKRYRSSLAQMKPGAACGLAPTQRSAADIRGRLLNDELAACLTPSVTTFDRFAESVLAASDLAIRPIDASMKRRVIARILEETSGKGRLKHFQPIAATPGLVDLFAQIISELKRLEIWPDDLRAAAKSLGLTAKDRELLSVYEAYQGYLTEHGLYDPEGRFWSARELLRDHTGALGALELVIVDGFTDFTRTQHEMLEILASRVQELHVSLPLEGEPARTDLFGKSIKTLDELRKGHPALTLEASAPREADAWPAMAQIERQVFRNPRATLPQVDPAGVEIIAAARQLGEVEALARRIKLLLLEGDGDGNAVRPEEIGVVLRSLDDYAPLIREVFSRYGIPAAVETGRGLIESPALTALVALIELVDDDWPFRGLVALLNSNYFQPDWPEWWEGAARDAERAIRRLQVPSGREALLFRLRKLCEVPDAAALAELAKSDPERAAKQESIRRRAGVTLALFERLTAAFDRLPDTATLGEWRDALKALAVETGLYKTLMNTAATAQQATFDRAAWDRLGTDLAELDQLPQHGDGDPRLERRELLNLLRDIMLTVKLPTEFEETGRVRVLTAHSARTLQFNHLFFAGLSEKSFSAPSGDDRLYNEAQLQQLRSAGLPLVSREERTQEEMLLFYEALTRAVSRLYLSYPAVDQKGQPLLPSPYLREVERGLGKGVVRHVQSSLSPIPDCETPLCEADLRLMAVARSRAKDDRLLPALAGTSVAVAPSLLAGLETTAERAGRESFGPFEGVFIGEAVSEHLAERFGPEHCWSASHLEQYAACPFSFFLERVLRLEPLAELGLETDYKNRGNVLHGVLARLHRRLNELNSGPVTPGGCNQEDFQRELDEAFKSLMELPDDEDQLLEVLREIDLRYIAKATGRYWNQHQTYDEQWQDFDVRPLPAHFEVSFGTSPAPADGLSTTNPLIVGEGEDRVLISGRIDRIDLGRTDGRTVFNIIDYKTGRGKPPKKEPKLDGRQLQLELYALAAEQVLLADQQAIPWHGGYWRVEQRGFTSWQEFTGRGDAGLESSAEWTDRRRQIAEKAHELVRGIKAAMFPVHSLDEDCTGRCPYSTVCRVNHVRSLDKTWPSPSLQG